MGYVIHELNIQEYIEILDWINKLNDEDRDYRHDEVNNKYSYRLIQNEYYTNILNKLFQINTNFLVNGNLNNNLFKNYYIN